MTRDSRIRHQRAIEIQEDIVAWLGSKQGREMHLDELEARLDKSGEDINGYSRETLREAADGWRQNEANALSRTPPTFCAAEFSLMAVTMAASAPEYGIGLQDLTSPEGLLVFEEPLRLERRHGNPDVLFPMARVLSWRIKEDDSGDQWLIVRLWSESKEKGQRYTVQSKRKLYPHPYETAPIGEERGDTENFDSAHFLRAVSALLRSPLTREESVASPTTSITKRSLGVDKIRRVYLRNPEYATYEAEEDRAEREGRPRVRAHWVRGHWRHQWYPSSGSNRWIWVDGYVKGTTEEPLTHKPVVMVANV